MRLKRLIGGALGATAALLLIGSPAFAAVTPTPTVVATDGQVITVAATGLGSVSAADIQLCNNTDGALITDAFAVAAQCAQSTTITVPVVAGAASSPFTVHYVPQEAVDGDIDWKCGPTGDATGSVIEGGLRVFSTCQIRVNPGGTTLDTSADQFAPITFVAAPSEVVPEAPLTILLPLGGVAVLGAAYFVLRRRPAAPAI